jgi:hypothetical protein
MIRYHNLTCCIEMLSETHVQRRSLHLAKTYPAHNLALTFYFCMSFTDGCDIGSVKCNQLQAAI